MMIGSHGVILGLVFWGLWAWAAAEAIQRLTMIVEVLCHIASELKKANSLEMEARMISRYETGKVFSAPVESSEEFKF